MNTIENTKTIYSDKYGIPRNEGFIIVTFPDNQHNKLKKIEDAILGYFDKGIIAKWLDDKFNEISDNDIWEDELLIPKSDWISKMNNKGWNWYKSSTDEGKSIIILLQYKPTNIKELIFLLHIEKVAVNSISIFDSKFGEYKYAERY